MKRFLCISLLATIFANATFGTGNTKEKAPTKVDSLETVVKMYTDSIKRLSAKLDAMNKKQKTKLNDGRYFRLFAPPTFYHSAAGRNLSLDPQFGSSDKVVNAIDMAMMRMYLERPDLVANCESRLKEVGTVRNDVEEKVTQNIELTDKVESMPETPVVAPTSVVVKKPNFWKFNMDTNLQFLQNYVSDNWYKGGESNYSMVSNVTVTANYNNKSGLKFDNKLELKLGFQTSRDDTIHAFKANEDLIRYTGKLGIQATKKWYYTLQLLAYTQFTKGLRSNDEKVYSDFMSPFNLNLGLGMDYGVDAFKSKLKGSVNISALSFNFRYVDRKNLADRYSIKGNHRTLENFGSQLTVDLTWELCEQVHWRTRLYAYTTYERSQLEWENTFTLKVSRFISANIFLHPRFDDSNKYDEDLGYWQFREYSSLGFTYSF